jgi:ankyrin repeat protein
LLLDRAADPDKASDDGTTPLCVAVQKGHEAVVKLLLDRRADASKDGPFGTPASIAGELGHARIVALFEAVPTMPV